MKKKDYDDSTKERLLKVALKQFATDGFEKTTTRSIVAEADANLSAISFHFENKEKLYLAVLKRTFDIFAQILQPIFTEIEAVEKQGMMRPDIAWEFILAIMEAVIEKNFKYVSSYENMLVKRELLFPSDVFKSVSYRLLPLYRNLEKLFMIYTGSEDKFWAANTSYIIVSMIHSYNMLPQFMEYIVRKDISDPGVVALVKANFRNSVISGTKSILQDRKNLVAEQKRGAPSAKAERARGTGFKTVKQQY